MRKFFLVLIYFGGMVGMSSSLHAVNSFKGALKIMFWPAVLTANYVEKSITNNPQGGGMMYPTILGYIAITAFLLILLGFFGALLFALWRLILKGY